MKFLVMYTIHLILKNKILEKIDQGIIIKMIKERKISSSFLFAAGRAQQTYRQSYNKKQLMVINKKKPEKPCFVLPVASIRKEEKNFFFCKTKAMDMKQRVPIASYNVCAMTFPLV